MQNKKERKKKQKQTKNKEKGSDWFSPLSHYDRYYISLGGENDETQECTYLREALSETG
tara:strand:- start:854 stop:1030 length:177 start_codon:yes stop_codon:yes gene_type:complete